MKSDVERYARAALALALSGRDPVWTLGREQAMPHVREVVALRHRYSNLELSLIDTRIARAVREVIEDMAPPPQAHMARDPISVVEADIVLEGLVRELRQRAVAARRPSWLRGLSEKIEAWENEERETEKTASPPPAEAPTELEVKFDGERSLKVGATTITLPIPIWRGLYQDGQMYSANDLVTFKGSVWIATQPTGQIPGNGATAWRLAIKRGKDGKDGMPYKSHAGPLT